MDGADRSDLAVILRDGVDLHEPARLAPQVAQISVKIAHKCRAAAKTVDWIIFQQGLVPGVVNEHRQAVIRQLQVSLAERRGRARDTCGT